jgi:ClpP class serine protease
MAASAPRPRPAHAFDLVAREPWAIVPEVLETIAAISRRENESIESVESRLGRPLQNARAVTMRDGVALVPVTGPVFRYANLFTQISGATSVDVLARDFTQALDDPAVKALVLVVDSPGGQANGISELAEMIRAGAGRKPVVAYVDGAAQSAAYWLASAAGEVVASRTAMLGSIGAVVAIDANKRQGTVEIVSSQSPNKRPDVTTEAGRAQIQTLIDSLAQVFVEDVGTFRKVESATVLSDFGQGASFIASEAMRRGMVDRISTLEDVIAGLSGAPAKKGDPYMAHEDGKPDAAKPAIDRAYLAANHPDLIQALQSEGAAAERERILAIQALAMPGHDALLAELVADGKTTAPEAAVQLLAAEKAANQTRAEQLRAAAPQPVAHAAAPDEPTAQDSHLPVEDRAKANWEKDPDLRDEFKSLGAYTAYLKNHEAGRARVLGQK